VVVAGTIAVGVISLSPGVPPLVGGLLSVLATRVNLLGTLTVLHVPAHLASLIVLTLAVTVRSFPGVPLLVGVFSVLVLMMVLDTTGFSVLNLGLAVASVLSGLLPVSTFPVAVAATTVAVLNLGGRPLLQCVLGFLPVLPVLVTAPAEAGVLSLLGVWPQVFIAIAATRSDAPNLGVRLVQAVFHVQGLLSFLGEMVASAAVVHVAVKLVVLYRQYVDNLLWTRASMR